MSPSQTPTAPPAGSGRMSLAQLRALAAAAGFPDPITAAAVAMAESSGDPTRVNLGTPARPEHSIGLWQVNVSAHPEFDGVRLLEPAYNAQAALLIMQGPRGWSNWTAYTSGSYRKYMGASA